jgi:hypothetical protein
METSKNEQGPHEYSWLMQGLQSSWRLISTFLPPIVPHVFLKPHMERSDGVHMDIPIHMSSSLHATYPSIVWTSTLSLKLKYFEFCSNSEIKTREHL